MRLALSLCYTWMRLIHNIATVERSIVQVYNYWSVRFSIITHYWQVTGTARIGLSLSVSHIKVNTLTFTYMYLHMHKLEMHSFNICLMFYFCRTLRLKEHSSSLIVYKKNMASPRYVCIVAIFWLQYNILINIAVALSLKKFLIFAK